MYYKLSVIILLITSSFLLKGQKLYSGKLPNSLIHDIKTFKIDFLEFENKNSMFYHELIEDKFRAFDTSITSVECIALIKYNNLNQRLNPLELDELGDLAYELNERQYFDSAVSVCNKILSMCPNNLTGIKELSYAEGKLGKNESSEKSFAMMSLILDAISEYGNGTYESPWILNNYKEGSSIYDSKYGCIPSKGGFMLDKSNRFLGGYYGYSPRLNEILILYSNMDHIKFRLGSTDYIREGEY